MRRALVGLSVLAIVLGLGARVALADGPLNFHNGPMKNLYVDLIFWGNFSAADRQGVMDNVNQLARWLNGGSSGPGLEPAVHYYGVSGITPGTWLSNPTPVVYQVGHLDDEVFQPIVFQARAGVFGAAYDFQTNVPDANHIADQSSLPSGSNRLALVITKGTENYCVDAGNPLEICAPGGPYAGYHWWSDSPYGAVMSESIGTLSHEVMEAMTDPYPFNGWTASSDLLGSDEACDHCPYNGFSTITVDPPYIYGNNSGGGCNLEVPEQHAPMAATFEYGFRSQPLDLFYTMNNGHIGTVGWSGAGQLASAPFDLGGPSSTVTAVGKPAVTYSTNTGGERIFVKGSDAGLWMHYNGAWTSVGGLIYGEPKAVLWGTNDVLVTVLGLDDDLYFYSVQSGWYSFPAEPRIVGSPTVVSRAAGALDWFAVGEDGTLKWIAFNSTSGFTPAVTISNGGLPFLATPAAVVQGTVMELFGNAQGLGSMWQTSWDGSRWASMQDARFAVPASEANYGFEGTPAAVSWGPGRFDVFTVSRNGKLWWWYTTNPTNSLGWINGMDPSGGARNPPALVNSGVTGDPVAVSRSSGELEVFYRTTTGSLVHLTYSNGHWGSPENLPLANPIQ